MSLRTSGCIKYPAQLRMVYALGNHEHRAVHPGHICSASLTPKSSKQVGLPAMFVASGRKNACIQPNVSERFAIALISSTSDEKNDIFSNVVDFSTTSRLGQSSNAADDGKPNMDQIERVCAYLNEEVGQEGVAVIFSPYSQK